MERREVIPAEAKIYGQVGKDLPVILEVWRLIEIASSRFGDTLDRDRGGRLCAEKEAGIGEAGVRGT